jgi:hypothetical protein
MLPALPSPARAGVISPVVSRVAEHRVAILLIGPTSFVPLLPDVPDGTDEACRLEERAHMRSAAQ